MRRQQNQYSSVLTKPENANAFANSVFLNQIIARRGVSWTRVFEDLSTVLPPSVALQGIRLPQIDSEDVNGANRVQLDMVVGTTKPESVITLLEESTEIAPVWLRLFGERQSAFAKRSVVQIPRDGAL